MHLMFIENWENTPEVMKTLARLYCEVDEVPKVVLLFDYLTTTQEGLIANCRANLPEIESFKTHTVKFLPKELDHLIVPGLFANNMFTLVLGR